MPLQVLSQVEDARQFREQLRSEKKRLALVPTMGYLHEGHSALMREGKRRAEALVTSIFVNPIQFGPNEDLARYPRDLQGDLSRCEQVGVDAVFVPGAADIYPEGFQTFVEVTALSQGWCGERRPGHFRGVATVVTKLFAILRPEVAVFGEKDYQQLQLIRRLNQDLNLGVEVIGLPTVRESDGLAMSSRNAYLSPAERNRALSLSAGLTKARQLAAAGVSDAVQLIGAVRQELERAQLVEDYLALVDARTLQPLAGLSPTRPARLLVAAFVGRTRLIDNAPL
jgi:pantoate--beta-alanine ligase